MALSLFRRLRVESSVPKSVFGLPIALLLGVALLTTGCHPRVKDPKDPKFIVAEKGNWQITRADLDKEIDSYLQQHQMTLAQVPPASVPKMETFMLDNMVLKKLMLEQAATLQLQDVDKDTAAEIDALKGRVPPGQDFDQELKSVGMTEDDLKQRIHEQVVITKVLEQEAFKNDTPTEQDINDFYTKNKDKFNVPPQARASRVLILVDDKMSPADKAAKKKAIDKAHERVVHGEEFSKVATEVSEDQFSKARGGDMSWFKQGENEPGFDTVAFSSKVGTVSPVFETVLGYQFIEVTDTKPGGIATLADASSTISKYLTELKRRQETEAYTTKLLADGGVTFYLVRVDLHAPAAPGDAQAAPDAQGQGGAPDAQAPAPAADASAAPATPAPTADTPH